MVLHDLKDDIKAQAKKEKDKVAASLPKLSDADKKVVIAELGGEQDEAADIA